ncbi:MAG TPA: Sua5/YciO/YrdC/YwlC family protein [Dokdonella sp.]|uniref:L-threonylcarbamoyladenylate synthase n=1 Tax=Dokdonella sp. TaxID=2291710 RepID=UPI002D7E2F57|nr:Sua5/YciO/YrdC/YwlC family protein [Dokdonella sp.]HET9031513.1 Sua5/YciO/YrdC/YwlC family protein [Dokdonella sp.]
MEASIAAAAAALRSGGVIAYPTEAVWGLGCDPHNEVAVRRIFALKQRPQGAGVILIGADFSQIQPFLGECSSEVVARAMASWPGPNTWIFPRNNDVPAWIVGEHAGIAVRITSHPIARAVCVAYGAAIVSTSANTHGQEAARSEEAVRLTFGDQLDAIVSGPLGGLERPTVLRDAISGKVLRH